MNKHFEKIKSDLNCNIVGVNFTREEADELIQMIELRQRAPHVQTERELLEEMSDLTGAIHTLRHLGQTKNYVYRDLITRVQRVANKLFEMEGQ